MGKLKLLGFLVVAVGILVFGCGFSNVSASEKSLEEFKVDVSLSNNEVQEVKHLKKNGDEVTIRVEPVEESLYIGNPIDDGLFSANARQHYYPDGTSTYKVIAFTPYMCMSYYVTAYVPSAEINSKITKYDDEDYWIIGGYLSGITFTGSSKLVEYKADAIWMGGLGAANVYLKASLSSNVLTCTSRM